MVDPISINYSVNHIIAINVCKVWVGCILGRGQRNTVMKYGEGAPGESVVHGPQTSLLRHWQPCQIVSLSTNRYLAVPSVCSLHFVLRVLTLLAWLDSDCDREHSLAAGLRLAFRCRTDAFWLYFLWQECTIKDEWITQHIRTNKQI